MYPFRRVSCSILFVVGAATLPLMAQTGADRAPGAVESAELGTTNHVHRVDALWTAGQFKPDDIPVIQHAGISRVITLRPSGELDWDERPPVESAGLQWIQIPFGKPEELSDEIFDDVRQLLNESPQPKTLLHCASANRVGAVWLVHRVLDQGVEWETALEEARTIGLKSDGYVERVREYIAAQRAKPAVPPTLNRDFLDPNLNVEEWLGRFEVESREIFAQRLEILKQCGIQSANDVADVGAGTGLFTRLFANEVGSEGTVFAVEISPAFLTHINQLAQELDLGNVTSVLCREDSVTLPASSIDLAFVCDTYHHFAYPAATLASIRAALRPGGQLIVVDFERLPGTSRQWIIDHVRAGKVVVRAEIETAGFEFVDEPAVAGLTENYMLRFRVPAESSR